MLVANALFSDGAAAVVARAGPPAAPPKRDDGWSLAASGTLLLDDSADDMTWRIGDHGFRMTLSARVPELIRARVGSWLEGWLAEQGLGLEQIGSWAIHPGGPRIVSSVEGALGLVREHTAVSREVLAELGNMSSATILFILERLRRRAAPRPCVALAFGPGLVVEAALLR
jgi:predicted naringenin-chalcone synthase